MFHFCSGGTDAAEQEIDGYIMEEMLGLTGAQKDWISMWRALVAVASFLLGGSRDGGERCVFFLMADGRQREEEEDALRRLHMGPTESSWILQLGMFNGVKKLLLLFYSIPSTKQKNRMIPSLSTKHIVGRTHP